MSSLVSVVIDTSKSVRNYTTVASSESIYIDTDDIVEIRKVSDTQSLITLLDGQQYTANQTLASLAASVNASYTSVVSINVQETSEIKGYAPTSKTTNIWLGAQHVVELRRLNSLTSKIIMSTGTTYVGLEDNIQQSLAQRLSVNSGGGGGGISALTNDVAASGVGIVSATVVAIQGNNVSSASPASGQFLRWNTNANQWVPTTVAIPDFYIHAVLNETQTGVSELHIGSYKLNAGSTILSTSAAMMGCTSAQDTAYLRLRRFTGGSIVATWTKIGLLDEVSLGQSVSISNTDWYDLYLYSGGANQTAIVKGLRISYTN